MYGEFFLFESEEGKVTRAERLAFGETAGRNEAWLRDTLFAHPEILPIREIDPSYAPLIPLCTELRTEAGPLDIAFINRNGLLTLVECKLWRNPESRRKVVAQTLDYARAIARWSYSDLQRQVSMATGKKGNVPFDLVKNQVEDVDEARFIDATYSALRNGRFLLLIAGDGIREDVSAITDLINNNAASGFSFGLVEVAMYGLDDGGMIIQPRTIAKSKLLERNVVVLNHEGNYQLVDSEESSLGSGKEHALSNDLSESPKQAAYREWWSPVMAMQFDDPDQDSPKLFYPNNVRVALQVPQIWITAFRYGTSDNTKYLGVGTSGRQCSDQEIIRRLLPHKNEILDALPDGSELKERENKNGDYFGITNLEKNFSDDDQKRQWLMDNLNSFVNVLRPWIDRIKADLENEAAR